MNAIDLRSDTVTKPSDAMKAAMFAADVGDDVYGEDPTVQQLEHLCAELLGKPAALFAPSGTQSNLLALMSHCGRGDEYIVGQLAHTYKYEGGGAAVLGSIQPQPLNFEEPGFIALEAIEQAIKPHDVHFAKTRLICLENTCFGVPHPQGYAEQVAAIAAQHQLKLHLDGARLFNAAVKQDIPVKQIAKPYDSISICLSKGLGAPVGSVLVGSVELIEQAKHWRKMLGGGMRQSGLLAAAGIYALHNNVARLADDHRRAQRLHQQLSQFNELELAPYSGVTNMVFVKVPEQRVEKLKTLARESNIILPEGTNLRLVTHMDIDDAGIDRTLQLFQDALA
ncbi:MAG: low-specificity L-threonine aldolase [Gammaproteobacteria bacterium]|nr:low-specificity L-threonine aldolase [Gammaproteobacteria bacterium]